MTMLHPDMVDDVGIYPEFRAWAGMMGRLIAAHCARPFFLDVRVPGSGSSSQSARGRCTMGLREGRTSQGGRRPPLGSAVHTIKRDDPAHVSVVQGSVGWC